VPSLKAGVPVVGATVRVLFKKQNWKSEVKFEVVLIFTVHRD
jgi:hypothetical protein